MADTLPILVVEDDADLREALELTLASQGYAVRTAASGPEALALLAREAVALVLTDLRMAPMDGLTLLAEIRQKLPHLPVAIMTAYGDVPATVALAERVAGTDATVLLTGETGVGKEVYARWIHRHSPRREGPFVALNCAAIPEALLEATLFGYEKGAFTGAATGQPGKFEQAQGGTILLDEISEMALPLQAKLLRVLQEREVERLGGKRAIALDVRVIATTNRNLAEEVAAGRFRQDLFYRLNVFPLAIPALRDRPGDILPLARYFLAQQAREWRRPAAVLTEEAEQILLTYSWPGNVRELYNTMQRAMILAPGPTIDAATLRSCLPAVADHPDRERSAQAFKAQESAGEGMPLRDWERERILRVLAEEEGSRKRAAERLGIPERTLRYRLRKYREAGYTVPGVEGE